MFLYVILSFFCFLSVTLFCLAAVVFPIGFHVAAIGGRPYKLPHHTQVGSAYVLFIMAIFFTVISELFSSRVCLPVLWWCPPSLSCPEYKAIIFTVVMDLFSGLMCLTVLWWCPLSVSCAKVQGHLLHSHPWTVLQSSFSCCDGVLLVFTDSKHRTLVFTVISELFCSWGSVLWVW